MSNSTETKTVDVLIGSPRDEFWRTVEAILKDYYPYRLKWVKSAEELAEITSSAEFSPLLALIDGFEGTDKTNEWTQTAKMNFDRCPIIILHAGQHPMDFEKLKKNGATEIMHINYDREFISDMILALAPVDMEGSIPKSALLAVDTRDFMEDSDLNFDLYVHLPSNNKTLKYRKEGAKVEKKDLEKFQTSEQHMYVKKTQTKAFFEYARTMASMKDVDAPVSITEKLNKSKKNIYDIMNRFMNGQATDYESGRAIYERCKEIIEEFDFTKDFATGKDLFNEICRFTGATRSCYNDAINMAAFAAYFAQGLGWDKAKREAAALAGLLHNVGIAQLPSSAINKTPESMTDDELAEFKLYPERSVIMVKGKKVPLPPEVSQGIAQHRERSDGRGFPHGIKNDRMDEMGKLLIIAWQFLDMTGLKDERAEGFKPGAALQFLKEDAIKGNEAADLVMISTLAKKLVHN